jgi:acyl-CoA synthetase (AMP-forming)/AMP-acid ligase II
VTFTPLVDATETELAQTVGRPVPPYLVRVRPLEGEFGAIGEVEILSPFRFNRYWGDAAATAKAVGRNGWLLTGDLGTLDGSGALRLTGRAHRVFKSGGYNVSPTEIEAALLELPEVFDACVVGVEDPLWGHVPVAFVVASTDGRDADKLLGRLRDRLANYKIPKRLLFIDSMPLLAIGKVNVKALLSKLSADP